MTISGGAGRAPIGIFDSGLGGLTVVREMRRVLPRDRMVYVGDTAHAPYGGQSQADISRFSFALTDYLLQQHHARGVVIACNTATAASADALRETFPHVPIIGMEPAVKPAVRATRTGKIGILATVGTLQSARFAALLSRYSHEPVQFLTQPCPGLVEAIETGRANEPDTRALLTGYIAPLLAQNVDTLVLGCTHYPVLRDQISDIAGPNVTLIDTGEAVARRVKNIMGKGENGEGVDASKLELYTTGGDVTAFTQAAAVILGEPVSPVCRLFWNKGMVTHDPE